MLRKHMLTRGKNEKWLVFLDKSFINNLFIYLYNFNNNLLH